jgi:hypothetical protein
MKKFFCLFALSVLSGCLEPGESTGRLGSYQYTPVQNMGNGLLWLQGYDSEDAITGARAHCSTIGGSFKMVEMVPHTQKDRATLTFRC